MSEISNAIQAKCLVFCDRIIKPDGIMYHGFSLKVAIPSKAALLECITPEMFSKGCLLANKCIKMYKVIELHSLSKEYGKAIRRTSRPRKCR